ncbi:MAG TPA: NADPH-dependent FMN reductase [Opitutaceae bacterium]|nr:NADPH-dependent FMN reductase [Opitutaceae bacterium]
MRVLTICGSLRAKSSNRAILRAYASLMPAGVEVVAYEGLCELPHFNPDDDGDEVVEAVRQWRALVASADLLVISTPEYAHGLPGAFKNALDWLVSFPAFVGKRVVVLHAQRGSDWAYDSLLEILATMSAEVLKPACVRLALGSNALTEEQILDRDDLRASLQSSVQHVLETP